MSVPARCPSLPALLTDATLEALPRQVLISRRLTSGPGGDSTAPRGPFHARVRFGVGRGERAGVCDPRSSSSDDDFDDCDCGSDKQQQSSASSSSFSLSDPELLRAGPHRAALIHAASRGKADDAVVGRRRESRRRGRGNRKAATATPQPEQSLRPSSAASKALALHVARLSAARPKQGRTGI